jgi:hypothetical protein
MTGRSYKFWRSRHKRRRTILAGILLSIMVGAVHSAPIVGEQPVPWLQLEFLPEPDAARTVNEAARKVSYHVIYEVSRCIPVVNCEYNLLAGHLSPIPYVTNEGVLEIGADGRYSIKAVPRRTPGQALAGAVLKRLTVAWPGKELKFDAADPDSEKSGHAQFPDEIRKDKIELVINDDPFLFRIDSVTKVDFSKITSIDIKIDRTPPSPEMIQNAVKRIRGLWDKRIRARNAGSEPDNSAAAP